MRWRCSPRTVWTTALKRIKYLGIIAERDRALMQEYGSALDALAARQAEIAEKKEEILGASGPSRHRKRSSQPSDAKKAEILAACRRKKACTNRPCASLKNLRRALGHDQEGRAGAESGEGSSLAAEAQHPRRPGTGRFPGPWTDRC